jgi:hypothetical protein
VTEAAPPAGATWQTLQHHDVLARLLVPDGAEVTESDDERGVSSVTVASGPITAVLTAARAPDLAGLASTPPAFEGAAAARVVRTADNVTFQLEPGGGATRIVGLARGVRCTVDLDAFARTFPNVDAAFRLCSSVRPPPLGAWDRPDKTNVTAVPAGAWLAETRASVVGDSLLGPYAPKLSAGWFTISHTNCPADYDALGAAARGEAGVTTSHHDSAGGPAYVRVARSDRAPMVSSARVTAPRTDGCCVVDFATLFDPPSSAELDYVVALCDTTSTSRKR